MVGIWDFQLNTNLTKKISNESKVRQGYSFTMYSPYHGYGKRLNLWSKRSQEINTKIGWILTSKEKKNIKRLLISDIMIKIGAKFQLLPNKGRQFSKHYKN